MNTNRISAAIILALSANSAGAVVYAGDNIEFKWSLETGLGYETNAYHAPDHSYVDYYADPTGATVVTPVEKGGFFIPLNVRAEMDTRFTERTALVADYRFYGNYHPESALQNANSTTHKLHVGGDFLLGKKGNKGDAYAGVFVHSRDKVYVDPDSGEPKISTVGQDVSERYTYTSYGLEGDYNRKITSGDSIGVKAAYEDLDYTDPVVWSQYDHIYTMVGVYWEHKFASDTKLTLGVTEEVRDYSERHAYTADGRLLASSPLLTYTYWGYQATLRRRFSDNTLAYFDYELLQRSDDFVGYNDMNQTRVKVRLIQDLNERVRLRGKVAYYYRDYANAFNFEDPTRGRKTSSGWDLQLRGEYQWNPHKIYYLELERKNRDNTDDRYQYVNNMVMLGAAWEY